MSVLRFVVAGRLFFRDNTVVMIDDSVAGGGSESLNWSQSLLQSRAMLWLVSILALALFSTANLPWQLDEFSQERQALASYGIVKEGRWLYQSAPRDREATKPPLVPWISAGLFAITRSWDFAWRFPSFAAAIALSILLLREATAAFGPAAGLLALSAFSLNHLSPRLASLVRTDMPLALIVFLIGLQILGKIRRQEPWRRRDRWLLFAALTAALFIKGPIVFAFLLPAVALFQWRWRNRNVIGAWSGWWPWLASLALFMAWVVGGIISQPGFFDQVVMHEFLGRFGTTEQRPHPPYYYVAHLLTKFAPWSELLIIFTVAGVRSHHNSIRLALRKLSPDLFWITCWALGGLLLMSLVPSKRLDRIFPLIPPLCLLVAAQFRTPPRRYLYNWSAAAVLLSILVAGQYVGARVSRGYHDHRDALVTFGREVRQRAQTNHWRYEIVESHDGGMLLYLEKLHFIAPERAVAEWNAGNLDALVVRVLDAPRLIVDLSGATLSELRSVERKDFPNRNYVLITR
ncbi:MAG: glycosyltransferase family 39 protein [Spartobacteria bacterium]